jgi:hypothetical protein
MSSVAASNVSAPERSARGTVRIITVHGTGDTATAPDGAKWFQRGSSFTQRLVERLAAQGFIAEVTPLLWSGANSAMARSEAANQLKRAILRLSGGRHSVHVVGHSHGGNVANDAACRLDWRRTKPPGKIASLATVGTPFLRTRVGVVETALTWLFATVLILGMAASLYYSARYGLDSGYALVFAVDLLAAPVLMAAFLRMHRARRRRLERPPVLAVRHPNDEAIAFLEHVERLNLDPFPRGSLARGAGPWSALVATVATVASPFYFADALKEQTANLVQTSGTASAPLEVSINYALSLTATGTLLAGLVFPIVYALCRGAALVVLEGLLRGTMNRKLGDVLKGLALGRDGGIQVGDVSAQSHHYGTQDVVLTGEVSERMANASSEATRRLFDKYRTSLFSIGADASNAAIELARDSMTWDSLIHTTYFDQPELAEIIAAHILAAERSNSVAVHGARPPV